MGGRMDRDAGDVEGVRVGIEMGEGSVDCVGSWPRGPGVAP